MSDLDHRTFHIEPGEPARARRSWFMPTALALGVLILWWLGYDGGGQ